VALSGTERVPPSDAWQRCAREGAEVVCASGRAAGAPAAEAASTARRERYLRPSIAAQSADPAIRGLAETIVKGAGTDEERMARILGWLNENIDKAPIDAFSALDVLKKRKAECQGHAYLYTALARAAGVPTRVVNGLVYSEQFQGFLYHSWAESFVGTRWQAVDPIFGQRAADATHLKLVEGEDLADLLPLTESVGKLGLRVLEVQY
jgi:transglutaminase-like putative cysteine protease